MKIDFKQTYFIGEKSYVREYLERQELYFQSGDKLTIYNEIDLMEANKYEFQEKLVKFNEKLKKCEGCKKNFTVASSFDSWYYGF